MIKKMILSLVTSATFLLGTVSASEVSKNNDVLNFLLGEIALQREDIQLGSKYFSQLSENQNIPYVLRQQFNIAYLNQNYPEALKYIQRIIADEPEDIEANMFETLIYYYLADNANVVSSMDKVAKLYKDKNNDNGYYFVYRELRSQIPAQDFLLLINEIAHKNQYPDDIMPLLASLLVDNDRYTEALQYLTKIIEKDPNNPTNYALLMYTYTLMNNPEKGLVIIKKAAENSSNMEIKSEYLQALINQFYYEDALKYAQEISQDFPYSAQIYSNLTYLYFAFGDYERAAETFNKVIYYKGDYVALAYRLTDFAIETGRIADLSIVLPNIKSIDIQVLRLASEAQLALNKQSFGTFFAIFDELRSSFPDRAEFIYNQQLDMLEKAGDYDLLLPYAELLDVVTGRELFIYTYFKAMAYYGMGDYQMMERTLGTWLENNPEDALALNAYGYFLLELAQNKEQVNKSVPFLQKAIELSPKEPAILDSIGWAYFKLDNYGKAREYLWPAFVHMKQPDVIAHYIALLIKENKLVEAKQLYQRLKIVYPDHKETINLMKEYSEAL